MNRMTRFLMIGGACAVAFAVGYFALPTGPAAPRDAPQVAFATLDGSPLSTGDLRGKVVLVNFWATSCAICVSEMPDLAATHEKFRAQGFDTVAVAMSYDRPDLVVDFTRRAALPFKVSLDVKGEIAKGFGDVRLTPTTFLVDRDGKILRRYIGKPDFGELHALIEKTLGRT